LAKGRGIKPHNSRGSSTRGKKSSVGISASARSGAYGSWPLSKGEKKNPWSREIIFDPGLEINLRGPASTCSKEGGV